MNVLAFLIAIIVLVLASWGFGSMMSTIGTLRGWNTKNTFWLWSIVYAIVLIIADALYLFFPSTYEIEKRITIIVGTILVIGIISPIVNTVLKREYTKNVGSRSINRETSSITYKNSTEKKSSVQEAQSSNLSNDSQHKTRDNEASKDRNNFKPKSGLTLSKIFMSYRRSDGADIAGRIYDRLVGRFGKEPIFKDVDSIPLGLDFKEYLDKQVGKCHVLLAIIGDGWLDAKDQSGNRRLDDPADFVRIEIESALERNIPVIPLLIRGASMPEEENLPPSLRKLVYRNGIPIRSDPDFHRDMDRLIKALEGYVE